MRLKSVLSTIPLRYKDSDTSEMVSQLLYGEEFDVLEERTKWMRVRTEHDGYEGWLAKEHGFAAADSPSERIGFSGTLSVDQGNILISPSSKLTSEESARFRPDEHAMVTTGPLDIARSFLNTPYLWGGRSRWGIDCSGLVQVAFQCMGKEVSRDAYQQAEYGEPISYEDILPGDLVFFENDSKKINHVGFCLSATEILHASGYVRIDALDEIGITRRTDGLRTHHMSAIKRISI